MKVKKYIEIDEELLIPISEGRHVKGEIHRDLDIGRIVFNAYNVHPQERSPEKLIGRMDFGRVTETKKRIKVYESIPKVLGTARINGILDREINTAKDALIVREIIDRV